MGESNLSGVHERLEHADSYEGYGEEEKSAQVAASCCPPLSGDLYKVLPFVADKGRKTWT
jgi:hypothetical protein